MARRLLLLGCLVSALGLAAPLGNPNAPKGGSILIGFPAYPKTLLYYLAVDEPSHVVNAAIFESLLDGDPRNYDPIPGVASSWTLSSDKKIFTFKMNPNARFSDGIHITAHDVKFTWDTLLNPKHNTAPHQSYLSSFESCTVIDDHTVQFVAKTLHFQNLEKAGGLFILPRHFFSRGDFNKSFHARLLGSGPYSIEEVKQGERIVLKRNQNYWAKDLPRNIGRYNFDRIVLKVVSDANVMFELFKKGDIDFYYFLSAKMWATETGAPPFEKGYIKKVKGEVKLPFGMMGFAWNMRKPLFEDRRVRLALSHLMNREKWIKDLFYNQYSLATGVMPPNSEYHSPKVKPVLYDPKRAKELLKEAGWNALDKDGVLIKKDGPRARFEFDLLEDNALALRYLTLYQEDLKKMGIIMNIRTVDWATSLKLMDDWRFDASPRSFTRDANPSDFANLWGSKEADTKGSQNYSGYKNPEVDELAKKIDETFDKKARIPLVRKLDEIIAFDQPWSFAWEAAYFRLAYWDKFSFPGRGYFDYSRWYNTIEYWWFDKEKDERLKKAISENKPLSK